MEESLARLDAHAEAALLAYGQPGMALAVTDRERTLALRTYGFAELALRRPVTPETLFQIGSIGKSFTACALLQLVDEGRVDLHVPVTEYLPWFEVRTRFEPITLHHLLTHSAGIVTGSDITSDSLFDVWALRHTETGSAPGELFWYSNVGYRVIGAVLEAVDGRAYADILRARVLEPCAMSSTEPVITNATRDRHAVAYGPWPDDRPVRYTDPLVPAPWFETATADGSVASTAGDMAGYLRILMNGGVAPGGRVLSDEGYGLMSSRAIEARDGGWYGYGLETIERDGRTYVGHGGSMVGFVSSMYADVEAGVGAVVLVNGLDWDDFTVDVAGYAIALAAGTGPLEGPATPDPARIENAEDYAGMYGSGDDVLELVANGDRLSIDRGGAAVTLERRGPDRFFVDHPDFELFNLWAERRDGRVVAMTSGPRRFVRDGEPDPARETERDPNVDAFAGQYRGDNPWTPSFRVVGRDGTLVLVQRMGIEERLIAVADGVYRAADDERRPERISFDAIVDGRALRATIDGCAYYRVFTS